LLSIYNGSIADAIGMPKLVKDIVVGVTFDLIIGRSYLLGTTGATKVETRRARLVGFSPYAMRMGLTVPLDVVDALEKEFRSEQSPPVYNSAIVRLASADDASALAGAIERFGLKISDSDRRTADAIRLATLALATIAGLVLLLAAFNIGHTFMAQYLERRAELALLRALGAGPRTLAGLSLLETSTIGLFGGLAGVGLGAVFAAFVDRLLQRWVSDIPLRPEHFFVFDWRFALLGVATALACAVLGAVWPTVKALRDSPARILSSVE
jgi:ABC-type lipoprotein release transport system permease subunit